MDAPVDVFTSTTIVGLAIAIATAALTTLGSTSANDSSGDGALIGVAAAVDLLALAFALPRLGDLEPETVDLLLLMAPESPRPLLRPTTACSRRQALNVLFEILTPRLTSDHL